MATSTVVRSGSSFSGAVYGLGVIGAWVWFWQQENGFWGHVWAIVEGIFWPAYMVYWGFQALD